MRTPKEFAIDVSPTMMGLRDNLEQLHIDKFIYEWMERYAIEYHESKLKKINQKSSEQQNTSSCECDNCSGKIEYYRMALGVKKYGFNSDFMKAYFNMVANLRHHELNEFFDKWDVPKN